MLGVTPVQCCAKNKNHAGKTEASLLTSKQPTHNAPGKDQHREPRRSPNYRRCLENSHVGMEPDGRRRTVEVMNCVVVCGACQLSTFPCTITCMQRQIKLQNTLHLVIA